MEKNKADQGVLLVRLYICLICFSILGHALSDYLRLNPGFIAPVASFATLISGIFASFRSYWSWSRAAVIAILFVVLWGAGAEIVGLRTGFPFGHYHYTHAWWPTVTLPQIGIFPLLLPLAWVLVVGSSALATQNFGNRFLSSLAAAGVATGLDLVMEGTLAGKMGYWKWEQMGPLPGNSPWSNSVSWFLLSLVGAFALNSQSSKQSSRGPAIIVLLGQLVLMATLRFT